MTETDSGAWLLGSHNADWSVKPLKDQAVPVFARTIRARHGRWLPGPRPDGWFAEGLDRMDGRPINLGGKPRALHVAHATGPSLYAWSEDDGKTWTKPAPSSLVHPDAPPMLSHSRRQDARCLSITTKCRTRCGDLDEKSENMKVRSEIWAATSTTAGNTWSERDSSFANAGPGGSQSAAWNYQCSYLDAFTDDGVLHLFVRIGGSSLALGPSGI